jgi:hypothetical protein
MNENLMDYSARKLNFLVRLVNRLKQVIVIILSPSLTMYVLTFQSFSQKPQENIN